MNPLTTLRFKGFWWFKNISNRPMVLKKPQMLPRKVLLKVSIDNNLPYGKVFLLHYWLVWNVFPFSLPLSSTFLMYSYTMKCTFLLSTTLVDLSYIYIYHEMYFLSLYHFRLLIWSMITAIRVTGCLPIEVQQSSSWALNRTRVWCFPYYSGAWKSTGAKWLS